MKLSVVFVRYFAAEFNKAQSGVSSLVQIGVERYELKANQNFLKLQDELASTENQILTARTRFNETVRPYNNHIKIFPNSVFAGMFGKENHTLKLSQVLKHLLKYNFKYNTFRLRERHKKIEILIKKGFLFKDFERGKLMTIFSNYSDFKIYAVHEVSEKKQNKQKINLCQNRSF
jgi:hypothetical protein